MNVTDRLNHISFLRAVAIILVVLGHATRDMNHPYSHMYSTDVIPLLEIFKQCCLPVFVWQY